MGLNKLTRRGTLSGDLIRMEFSELNRVSRVFIMLFCTGVFVSGPVYMADLLMVSPNGVQLEEA
jgi:hypothetical protein